MFQIYTSLPSFTQIKIKIIKSNKNYANFLTSEVLSRNNPTRVGRNLCPKKTNLNSKSSAVHVTTLLKNNAFYKSRNRNN